MDLKTCKGTVPRERLRADRGCRVKFSHKRRPARSNHVAVAHRASRTAQAWEFRAVAEFRRRESCCSATATKLARRHRRHTEASLAAHGVSRQELRRSAGPVLQAAGAILHHWWRAHWWHWVLRDVGVFQEQRRPRCPPREHDTRRRRRVASLIRPSCSPDLGRVRQVQ